MDYNNITSCINESAIYHNIPLLKDEIIKELNLRKLHFIALSRSDLDYTNFKTFSK